MRVPASDGTWRKIGDEDNELFSVDPRDRFSQQLGPRDLCRSLSGNVYASTNLVNWTPLGTATLISNGMYQFTDSAATNLPRRFYKVSP